MYFLKTDSLCSTLELSDFCFVPWSEVFKEVCSSYDHCVFCTLEKIIQKAQIHSGALVQEHNDCDVSHPWCHLSVAQQIHQKSKTPNYSFTSKVRIVHEAH